MATPYDGEQTGTLLIGVAGEGDAVTAGWVDSWHQPDVAALRGHATPSGAVRGLAHDLGVSARDASRQASGDARGGQSRW